MKDHEPADRMRFCTRCGGPLALRVPPGDNRFRHVCTRCGEIHYQNPKLVTGCIPEHADGRILLCRRAIAPKYGLWTLPAGFMENGESCQEGAARETLEEANARVEILQLYTTFNLPHIDQVYLLFRGRLLDDAFGPGDESLEVALFDEASIPWDRLAFNVIRETLLLYYEDRRRGHYLHRVGDLRRTSTGEYRFTLLNNA